MLPFLRQPHITDYHRYIIHRTTKKPECNDVTSIFTFDDICYLKSDIRMNSLLAVSLASVAVTMLQKQTETAGAFHSSRLHVHLMHVRKR